MINVNSLRFINYFSTATSLADSAIDAYYLAPSKAARLTCLGAHFSIKYLLRTEIGRYCRQTAQTFFDMKVNNLTAFFCRKTQTSSKFAFGAAIRILAICANARLHSHLFQSLQAASQDSILNLVKRNIVTVSTTSSAFILAAKPSFDFRNHQTYCIISLASLASKVVLLASCSNPIVALTIYGLIPKILTDTAGIAFPHTMVKSN